MGASRAGTLADRTAVVVGVAGGVGRAVARALAGQGATVAIADRDEQRLRQTLDGLNLVCPECAIAVPVDIRNDRSVRALARASIRAMGSVDIVVNAAAIHLQRRLERTTSRDWLSVLDTNLIGAVRIAAAFVPYMLDRRSGQIVNTISVGGLVPGDAASIAYDSAYGAVAAYTHSLDRQLRRDGVRASLYVVGATGPLPGLRSRAADHSGENLVKGLVEGRFLILADSRDLASLRRRWGEHELAGRLEIAIRKQ